MSCYFSPRVRLAVRLRTGTPLTKVVPFMLPSAVGLCGGAHLHGPFPPGFVPGTVGGARAGWASPLMHCIFMRALTEYYCILGICTCGYFRALFPLLCFFFNFRLCPLLRFSFPPSSLPFYRRPAPYWLQYLVEFDVPLLRSLWLLSI